VVAYGRRPKRNQRESAYVSRQRTWRTLPEPSSAGIINAIYYKEKKLLPQQANNRVNFLDEQL
jgi:hypothetical protein